MKLIRAIVICVAVGVPLLFAVIFFTDRDQNYVQPNINKSDTSGSIENAKNISASDISNLEDYDSYIYKSCTQASEEYKKSFNGAIKQCASNEECISKAKNEYGAAVGDNFIPACLETTVLNDMMSTGTIKLLAEQEFMVVSQHRARMMSDEEVILNLREGLKKLESNYYGELRLEVGATASEYQARNLKDISVDASLQLITQKYGRCWAVPDDQCSDVHVVSPSVPVRIGRSINSTLSADPLPGEIPPPPPPQVQLAPTELQKIDIHNIAVFNAEVAQISDADFVKEYLSLIHQIEIKYDPCLALKEISFENSYHDRNLHDPVYDAARDDYAVKYNPILGTPEGTCTVLQTYKSAQ